MNGIDEEFALLKNVRADLSENRKKLTDSQKLTADERNYLAFGMPKLAYAGYVN